MRLPCWTTAARDGEDGLEEKISIASCRVAIFESISGADRSWSIAWNRLFVGRERENQTMLGRMFM
jgi:hypothetical protein